MGERKTRTETETNGQMHVQQETITGPEVQTEICSAKLTSYSKRTLNWANIHRRTDPVVKSL